MTRDDVAPTDAQIERARIAREEKAAEDFSSVKLQPILDLWGDLIRAGGMPALQPAHIKAMARALKRAAAQ